MGPSFLIIVLSLGVQIATQSHEGQQGFCKRQNWSAGHRKFQIWVCRLPSRPGSRPTFGGMSVYLTLEKLTSRLFLEVNQSLWWKRAWRLTFQKLFQAGEAEWILVHQLENHKLRRILIIHNFQSLLGQLSLPLRVLLPPWELPASGASWEPSPWCSDIAVDGVSDEVAMIEDFPRAEVDFGKEGLIARLQVHCLWRQWWKCRKQEQQTLAY